jgi:hypothetical protein
MRRYNFNGVDSVECADLRDENENLVQVQQPSRPLSLL